MRPHDLLRSCPVMPLACRLFGGKALGLPLRKALSVPENVAVSALEGRGRSLEALPAFRPVAVNHDRRRLVGRQFGEIEFVLTGVETDRLFALLPVGHIDSALDMAF